MALSIPQKNEITLINPIIERYKLVFFWLLAILKEKNKINNMGMSLNSIKSEELRL